MTTAARPVRSGPIFPIRLRVLGLVLLVFVGVGCPCVRGAVNASPGLRWWLFSKFGAEKMCPEMLKRSAALKLDPNGNTVGRFFPTRCFHELNDATRTMTLHFGGSGFAWTPLAGRVGFSTDASIEYRPDFRMTEKAVYVWARYQRTVQGPDFKVGSVENKLADWTAKSPAGYLFNTFANQIVSSQLASGFTVVHTDDGDEFSVGILDPPARPKRPFDTDDGSYVFANETTEIRYNQFDYLGPFEIVKKKQVLRLRMKLSGPPVDVMVFPRGPIDTWREGIQMGVRLAPPPIPPVRAFPLQPGGELKQKLALPPGQYVIVVDNSHSMGVVNPPWSPLSAVGGSAAVLSYAAELTED